MRISRLSISISPSASISCKTREKYSGVSDRREAMVALLTGKDTVTIGEGLRVQNAGHTEKYHGFCKAVSGADQFSRLIRLGACEGGFY